MTICKHINCHKEGYIPWKQDRYNQTLNKEIEEDVSPYVNHVNYPHLLPVTKKFPVIKQDFKSCSTKEVHKIALRKCNVTTHSHSQ